MNLATAMLYPIVLLFPAAGAVDDGRSEDEGGYEASGALQDAWQAYAMGQEAAPPFVQGALAKETVWPFAVNAFQDIEPDSAWQVRIEQRMTIRITPHASRATSPEMFFGMPGEEFDAHFSERKIGKCLPMAGIAGVQPNGSNHLLLFMRDQRIVSAELERACRARDFYQGFYLSRTSDGQLCVDRDTLLSRSGMNCKLTRIRQLVAEDD